MKIRLFLANAVVIELLRNRKMIFKIDEVRESKSMTKTEPVMKYMMDVSAQQREKGKGRKEVTFCCAWMLKLRCYCVQCNLVTRRGRAVYVDPRFDKTGIYLTPV